MKRICARDPRHQNKDSSYFSFSSRDARVIFFEIFWNFHEKQLILGVFSSPVQSFSPTQRRTCLILLTHNGHPTHTTPAQRRQASGAQSRRSWVYCIFLVRVGRVCICPWSCKTGVAGGGCRNVFLHIFQYFFTFFSLFLYVKRSKGNPNPLHGIFNTRATTRHAHCQGLKPKWLRNFVCFVCFVCIFLNYKRRAGRIPLSGDF